MTNLSMTTTAFLLTSPIHSKRAATFLITLVLSIGLNPPALATDLERDINDTGEVDSTTVLIPYAFYSDDTEFAVATVLYSSARLQPQSSSLINAFVSSNDPDLIHPGLGA